MVDGEQTTDPDRDSVLVAETAERHDEIDVARSKESLTDAEARLKKLDPMSDDYAEQANRAQRARNRLAVAAS